MTAKQLIFGPVLGYVSRLRFPWLFAVTAAIFLADFAVPDLIPFADEILLGLATLLLGAWKKRKHSRLDHETAVVEAN